MAVVKFDRAAQVPGNIVHFEHVNVTVPDPVKATIFWIMGMGFTRDPYLMVGVDNMWANIGMQQFHLPTREPQVLRGVAGVVVPDLEALRQRLDAVKPRLEGTQFKWENEDKHVFVTCPWGNKLRCHAPGPEFLDMTLGVPEIIGRLQIEPQPRAVAAQLAEPNRHFRCYQTGLRRAMMR